MFHEDIGKIAVSFFLKVQIRLMSSLAASATSDEAQNNEKDVDDIQIELQCSKDVLLWAQLVAALLTTDYHLCVKDEELQQHKHNS